jgi:hypothetical protein
MWGESQRKFQKSAFDGPSFGRVVEEIFKRCDEEEIRFLLELHIECGCRGMTLSMEVNIFFTRRYLFNRPMMLLVIFLQLCYPGRVTPHPDFEKPDGGNGVV